MSGCVNHPRPIKHWVFASSGSFPRSSRPSLTSLTLRRGRSYGELDLLFENKVPAWRFKSTKVDRESCERVLLTASLMRP